MKIKTWLIPTGVLVLLSFLFSLFVRLSYTPLTEEELLGYTMNAQQDLGAVLERNGCSDFDSLTSKADVILFGSYTGEGSFTDEAVFSKIQVQQVLKGQVDAETITLIDEIYLYPPNNWYVNINGRSLLKKDHTYLFLLSKPPFSPYRVLPEEAKDPYLPVLSSAFGCYDFTVQEEQTETFGRESGAYQIKDIVNAEVVVSQKEDLDLYYQFKNEAYRQFGALLDEAAFQTG